MRNTVKIGWMILPAVMTGACHSIPVPLMAGEIRYKVPLVKDETARQYCSRLTNKADTVAQTELGFGIVLGVLSGAFAITGAALGPSTAEDANWADRNRNALVLGAGTLLALPATLLLTRSKDANAASATGGEAMGLPDDSAAMRQCLAARAALVNARSALADAAQKDAADRLKQYQEILDKARADKTAAAAARDPAGVKAAEAVQEAATKALQAE